ncbi:ABC transporter substrate-binding protein [Amaricoccus solimangrovi]|uniref:Extracellular solute-binding protein n=1 Tax=Amaricoccus solimangrovi TaxID=2589815 RepID=A0A501WF47_9RHOB|nr:extracellular solute-binding protein [Amaricoccus solimangrovi]TPE47115.1 extracellular solute-binding protein [Amaricoccus solimangrovi]
MIQYAAPIRIRPSRGRGLAGIAATLALVASSGAASAAGGFDTSDAEYTARAEAAVTEGKISEQCLPSSATPPEASYKAIPAPPQDLIDAAVKEGELVLNSGISDKPSVEAYKAAFAMRYPGIQMTVAAGGSAAFEERFLADHAAGSNRVDAAISNKLAWVSEALKEEAVLPIDDTIPGFFDIWPGGSWTWETPNGKVAPAFQRSLGIAYNTDLVSGDLVPTSYEDLARPEFKDQLIAMDPEGAITYARVWKQILDVVGEETMRKIGDNMIKTPLYSDIQPAAQALGAGGGMVIMEMGANVAATMKANGAPVEVVMPESTTGTQYTYAVSSTAPHPNAAKLFAYWLYSPEGQWVTSCAALASSVAYNTYGSKEFVQIEAVPDDEIARIKELLGL